MKLLLTIYLLVCVPFIVTAQSESNDQEHEEDQSQDGIVLIPVADPIVYSNTANINPPLLQAGAFLNSAEGGIEFTYRPVYGSYYGNVFLNSMMRPDQKISGAESIISVGVSAGREILLHDTQPLLPGRKATRVRANAEGTQFYTRFGPGIGVTRIQKIGNNTQFHPVIHSRAAAGFLKPVGNFGGFYIEIGGHASWYPTLNEIGLIGGPQLNIGFQISGSGAGTIPPVQY